MKLLSTIYKVTCHTDHVGPGSTFVAIKGFKQNGRVHIPQALAKGATTIVVEQGVVLDQRERELIAEYNAELRYVPSARKALAELSAQAYGYPANALKLIALTGTKGKTTSAFVLYHILRAAGYKVALLGTVKSCINDVDYETPLTTPQPDYLHLFFDLCKQEGVEYVIMEAAAQALSMSRLATLVFDAVAFTNFSLEHSEFYESMDEYFAAKCQLFDHVAQGGLVVLNADDDNVASSYGGNAETISMFGKGSLNCSIQESTLSVLKLRITSKNETYEVRSSSLLGEFSAYNILTAIAIAQKYGVTSSTIKQALESFSGVPGRLASYQLANGAVAIIDNAHTPSSFEAFFKAVRPLSDHIIVIFGSGGDRDALKRPIMGALAAQYADQVILTTDNPRSEDPAVIVQEIVEGIPKEYLGNVEIDLDRERAIRDAYKKTSKGSLLVLLGKGPVEYQHVGDEKIPFSEESILRSLRS